MAVILDAILNISISPMMPRWHHSVSWYGHIGEHIYAKTFCADVFWGLHPKSSFGNLTIKARANLAKGDMAVYENNSFIQTMTLKSSV